MDRTTIEKFGLEAIPAERKTTSWYEYAIIQFSFSPNSGNFLVPALAVLAGHLSFGWALLACIIGSSLAFYIVSVMALPGSQYGIPAQYANRALLGINGARYISSPMRVIASMYWFAVQTMGGTLVIQTIFEKLGGITLPFVPVSLLLSIFMSALALVGFEAVRKVTKYCLPILVLGGITVLILFLTAPAENYHFLPLWNSPHATNHFSDMIFYIGLSFIQFLAGAFNSADLSRYARSNKDSFWGLLIGNVAGFSFTALLAIYAALATGQWNPYAVAYELTDSKVIMLILFLSAMMSMILINTLNAYAGGFSLLNTFPDLGRVKSTLVFCSLAIVLSCFPALVNEAKQYISLMGVLVGPVIGVIFTEFVLVQKRTINLHVLIGDYHYNKRAMGLILFGSVMAFVIPSEWPRGLLTFGTVSILYALWSKKRAVVEISH